MSRNMEKEGEPTLEEIPVILEEEKIVSLSTEGNQEEEGTTHNNHDGEKDEEKLRLLLVSGVAQQIQVQASATTCQSRSTEGIEEKEGFNREVYLPRKQYYYVYNKDESNVKTASVTFLLVLFNLLWSGGLSYWHFHLDNFEIAVTTLIIILVSGATTAMAFFTTKASDTGRRNLWRCSKLAWLLAAIPCLIPAILSTFYFVSSLLDKKTDSNKSLSDTDEPEQKRANSDATRKPKSSSVRTPPPCSEEWKMSAGSTFLIESLTLCFPLAVFHLCALLEDPLSIPTVIGLYTLFGIFILSFSITFSRFHYDCQNKRDRFGEGTEKYLRFCYLWSAKIIWLVTFTILIVTARLRFPEYKLEAGIGAAAVLTAVHEIPLWICLLPHCGKLASKVSSLFFLIPQFTSLLSLIYWVNTDTLVYHTNIASIVLGVYFWSETIMLCGWLVDGSSEKDVDLVPLYPHFFGDIISSCFPEENNYAPTFP